MLPDLAPIFNRYEALRAEADGVFERIAHKFPGDVTCHQGCSDCCHALFDLSLVEAMYINSAFIQAFEYGPLRSQILERASETDRRLTRVKREMYQAEKAGDTPAHIMTKAAGARVRCPLLSDGNTCLLYNARPIICRLYGIPLDIGGKGHVCGLSGFSKGANYPTVQLARIQSRLENLSREIADAAGSRFELADVYVPLSMALLTKYDDAYLGIGAAREED